MGGVSAADLTGLQDLSGLYFDPVVEAMIKARTG